MSVSARRLIVTLSVALIVATGVLAWRSVMDNRSAQAVSGAVIVDDLDGGFSRGGPPGTCLSPGTNNINDFWCWQNGGYNGHYWYTWNGTFYGQANTGDYGLWRPNLPYTASYRVCAYVPEAHAYTTNARYQIFFSGGSTTVSVNQQPLTGWTNLGIWTFAQGTGGYVLLDDITGETFGTKQIGMDAVEWVIDGGSCGSGVLQTPTNTPPPAATSTFTFTPTKTNTPTRTPFGPTKTPTPPRTPRPLPTNTPTARPTNTPRPSAPRAVVLVHGWDFNASSWSCGLNGLQQWLGQYVSTSSQPFYIYCLIYRTREGVVSGAADLRNLVNGLPSSLRNQKVDIVAHSMGGLVSRYYIEHMGGRQYVKSLTMLGTPNAGTDYAAKMCAASRALHVVGGALDNGACDMDPGSPFLRSLNNSPGSHAGVSYSVITGSIGSGTLERPNDCIVPWKSAMGNTSRWHLNFPTALLSLSHVTASSNSAQDRFARGVLGCTGTGETDDGSVNGARQRVKNLILTANGLAGSSLGNSGDSAGSPPPEAPGASALALQDGTLLSGETKDLTVAVPGGQTEGLFTFSAPSSPDANLEFTLLRPDGTPVSSTDPDVTFAAGAPSESISETQYDVTSPAEGSWIMRIYGASVPAGGWPYHMQADVPGGISIDIYLDDGHYDLNQAVSISASVSVDGVPAQATVNASITRPDGTTDQMPLGDNLAGDYVGDYANTATCGAYQVIVTASGTAGGSAFTRVSQASFVVGVPGNAILDPCASDSDGDGLDDTEELDYYGTNPAKADTDGDGCADNREMGPTANLGGLRDPVDQWDYFNPTHDGKNRIDDILLVVHQFFKDEGDPAYNVDTDRTLVGPNAWNTGPPDGMQRVDDILNSVHQFFHDCS